MAFRELHPEKDVLHLSPQAARFPLHWSGQGPSLSMEGADSWAHCEYQVPHSRSRAADLEQDETLAFQLLEGVRHRLAFPVGQRPDGKVGWDPRWALLMALSEKTLSIPVFRQLVALGDPLIAHPSSLGPGAGDPLPVAIIRAQLPAFVRLKLLDCLPREALAHRHQDRPLVHLMVEKMGTNKGQVEAAEWLLLSWVADRTAQRDVVFDVSPRDPAGAPKREEVHAIMSSRVFEEQFGNVSRQAKSKGFVHFANSLLASWREERVQPIVSNLPNRPRLRRS